MHKTRLLIAKETHLFTKAAFQTVPKTQNILNFATFIKHRYEKRSMHRKNKPERLTL